MKFTWGTGILLAILAFAGFIMYFFIITLVDKKYDHELVTENYYAQELDFQKNIDAERQTLEAHMQVDIAYTPGAKEGIRLDFPTAVIGKEVIGVIFCYRPSDSQLDFTLPITALDGCSLVIPDNLLKEGRWNIRVEYGFEGKNYLSLFDKVNY